MRIYVRERVRTPEEGSRHPRFKVVAIEGGNLKVEAAHLRKMELERIASDTGAEIVYMTADHEGHGEKRHRNKE